MRLQVWGLEQSLPPSLHGLHSSQCLAPCYTPFFKVNCIYFGNYFKIINLCACRCQCLQSSQLKNLLPDCILQSASTLPKIQFLWKPGFSLFWDLTLKLHLLRTLVGKVANLTCVVVSLHACINLTWRQ